MSDTQKLKDVIKEYLKEQKDLYDKLNTATENIRQSRQEQEDRQSH